MSTTIKNMLVGIFILSSIVILVGIIMFLKPSVGDGEQTLYVRFSDINSINVGTRVLFAGKPVGEVVSIEEIRDARAEPTDELGRVYFFQLTLHIDSHVKVYNTDEISIKTSGLLGEKSISITPKAPPKGVSPMRITNQPIYADSVDLIQNALADFSELAAYMEESFKQLSNWLGKNGETVANTFSSTTSAMKEISQAVATYNETEVIHDLQNSVREFGGTLAQIQQAMTQMQERKTFANVGVVMENLKAASRNIEEVSADLADGKGTLGKLIVDSDLYLEINSLMTKANNLMNDINHYGVLFHLNKQWQRTRLQKINELNALNCPENFREYFQTEVDDINASMSRISLLIQKAECCNEREKIFENARFRSDFAELMRKADELSDHLRLYNQQLTDAMEN